MSHLFQSIKSQPPYLFNKMTNQFNSFGSLFSQMMFTIAVIGFFDSILMSMMDRKREFAVLTTIDSTNMQIIKSLVQEYLIIGSLSAIFSWLTGLFSTVIFTKGIQMFWVEFPIVLSIAPFIIVLVSAIIISLLSVFCAMLLYGKTDLIRELYLIS